MSFDVFLQKFEHGETATVDPISVRAVLMTKEFKGPDDHGFYAVRISDGTEVEFSARGLNGDGDFTSAAFHIRGMSECLAAFIWEVAHAGEMVIVPAMEDWVPILPTLDQYQHLPIDLKRDFPTPVVCESAAQLNLLLEGGYSSWRKYRDQVVGSTPPHL
jgi:hypothetical protein